MYPEDIDPIDDWEDAEDGAEGEEEDYDFDDSVDESGFDPFMGCYTYDC